MRARLLVAGLSLMAAPALYAQGVSSSCPNGGLGSPAQVTQDACQQAVDVFQYMAPQLGLGITGGNATLGRGGALGGLPHFTIGLRANLVMGTLPQVDNFPVSYTGAQSRELPTKSQVLPVPTLDAGIGLFKGLPLGVTNVGGVDLLLSASYIPEFSGDNFEVKVPDGSLKLGFGARVGIIEESLLLPGVSVTYLKRDLPTIDLIGTANDDTLSVTGAKVKTDAWRVVASKSLVMFGFAVGAGQDKYDQSATAMASVLGPTGRQRSGDISMSQKLTRTNVFADVSLNLPMFKIIGEIGQASGGTIDTYNTFEGKDADASRIYGSVGLRFQF